MTMSHPRVVCVHPGMSQSPTFFTANTFKAISSCLQHQHWSKRHNSSWLCKIKMCFMCLKLIFIFPDYALPALAATNPILSPPHCGHLPMSLSLMQAAPRHGHSCNLLIPSFTLKPHPHQPLLSLLFDPSGSTHSQQWKLHYPRGSVRPMLKMALELGQG